MCNSKLKSDIQYALTLQTDENGLVITVSDQVSGSIVGRRTIRCTANGYLSARTVADAIGWLAYRIVCWQFDLDCKHVRVVTERASRSIRDH